MDVKVRQQRALSVEPRFHKELIGLPKDSQKQVTRALRELQRDPSHESVPVKGLDGIWRRRVGAYRILFAVGDGWVHVYSVQHRSGVYAGSIAVPSAVPESTPRVFPELETTAVGESPETAERSVSGYLDEEELRAQGLPGELVRGIMSCKTTEDLLGLIDLGLPDHLFDQLMDLVGGEERQRERPWRQIELIRQDVIDQFFGRVLRLPTSRPVVDLTIVTPWITPWAGSTSSLKALVKFIRLRKARTTVITRPPDWQPHKKAITMLKSLKATEIVYLPQLHAKFFICDIAPVPFALVGSANATTRSLSNFEIGVLVRGMGLAESFVRELQSLVVELRSFGKRVKRRG